MAPNLVDKLLDALGLLPFGALLRLRKIRQLWRRLKHLRDTLDRIAEQVRRAEERLRRVRQRMRDLAERRDNLNRQLTDLRQQRERARSSFEQQRIDDRIRRAERDLERVHDDMGPAFDDITDAEAHQRGVQARQREYDFLGSEIFSALSELFLPMALLSCVANALGIDLVARAEDVEPGPYSVDGEYARFDGSAIAHEPVLLCSAHRPATWTMTDGTGRFRFDDLPPGEYTLAALGDTLCLRRFSIEKEDCEVLLGPAECIPHVVSVINDYDEPLPDIAVVLCGFSNDRVETIAIGETRVRGTVCLPRRPDLSVALLAYAVADHGVTLLSTEILDAKNKPYSKVRIESYKVRARVFDAKSGDPIPALHATALPMDGDQIASAFGRIVGFRASTDGSGSMQLHAPRPGRYLVVMSALGYQMLTTEMKIHEDKSTHLGTYKLKRLKQSAELMGVIRDPNGQPCGGYISLVMPKGTPTGFRTFADETGTFYFKGLPTGEIIIEVQGDRPAELAHRKITLHPGKRMETIITLKHSLEFDA